VVKRAIVQYPTANTVVTDLSTVPCLSQVISHVKMILKVHRTVSKNSAFFCNLLN